MAQGDTVTIDMGEKVEATFILEFNRAEVHRLPDADKFAEVAFEMKVPKRGFSHVTHQSGKGSPHATPGFFSLTGLLNDDPGVLVTFTFTSEFQSGDSVDLYAFFQSSRFEPAPDPPTYLGTVHIK